MTSNQEETQPNPEVATTEELTSWVDNVKASLIKFFSTWQVILGLIISAIVAIFIFSFFWQHIIAGIGMKSWAASSGARPIECMIKDTNDDQYVSCSAILNDQVVPLECGATPFNLGCRVNYGASAPNLRLLNPKSGKF